MQGEEDIVADQPLQPQASKSMAHSGMNRDEKKATAEAIRAEKALATQEARQAKHNMSVCQKFLRRTTKLSFNLGQALSTKFVKALPAATQKRLDATKAKLLKSQKALINTMKTAGKMEIDENDCETACKDGDALVDRLSATARMI